MFSFPSLRTFSGKCQRPAGSGMSGLKELLQTSEPQTFSSAPLPLPAGTKATNHCPIVPAGLPAPPLQDGRKQQRQRSGSTCGEVPAPSPPPTPHSATSPLSPHWKVTGVIALPPSKAVRPHRQGLPPRGHKTQEASGLDCPAEPGPGRTTLGQQGAQLPRGPGRHRSPPPPHHLQIGWRKWGRGVREERPHCFLPRSLNCQHQTRSSRGKDPDPFPHHCNPRPGQLTGMQ